VTRDAVEHPRRGTLYRAGGSAFYSALQAARLGLRTLILTQGVAEEIEELLAPYREEFELRVIPAEHTTTLSTRWMGASRTQRLLAWAGPIVEPIVLDTAILHIAPVARETPVSWDGQADFVGVTPQGLVRRWREDEGPPLVQLDAGSLSRDITLISPDSEAQPSDIPLVSPNSEAQPSDIPPVPPNSEMLLGDISAVALEATLLPKRFDAAVIAEHECPSCHALFRAAHRHGATVAVTAGPRPTTVHLPGNGSSAVQTPFPPKVAVRDDIGAGDVFAATFFVALAAGRAPLPAAEFANVAASTHVAGDGPDAIASHVRITP
jgi:hypothetical protein